MGKIITTTTDITAAPNPPAGSIILGFDLDGNLKKKDDVGVITPIETVLASTTNLSSAQILSLGTSPITLVSTPGVGKAIHVLSVSIKYTFNSIAFDNIGAIEIKANTGASPGQYFTGSGIITGGVSVWSNFEQGNDEIDKILENQSIIIQADTDPSTGNGSAKIYLTYRIITI